MQNELAIAPRDEIISNPAPGLRPVIGLDELVPHGLQRLFASDGEKRTVTAKRRRRTTTSSGERERAEAPKRDNRDSGSPPPPRRPSGGSSSGGSSPRPPGPGGSMSPRMLLFIGVVVVIFLIFGGPAMLFNRGGDSGGSQTEQATAEEPTVQQAAPDIDGSGSTTSESGQSTSEPVATGDGESWTIMLYQDADDKVLEKDIYIDLNEAERIGSTDRVNIVAQVDRYRGGYKGDGNWTSTKRFYVTQDDDLDRVRSEEIADLGELNMSDGETLIDFVTWAVDAYPADRYALILSDHGMGWPGGWSDPDPGVLPRTDIPLAGAMGDQLYLQEIDGALDEIRSRTGIEKLDLVGMDACLMSHIEVFSALAPHARYAVASQETEPALGWAYTGFLYDLVRDPSMDGGQVSELIVSTYIDEDQRIVDDQARADFVGAGRSGTMSAQQLTKRLEDNITLTAIDLSAMPSVISAVNDFSYALSGTGQKAIAKARTYAQSYTSIFGKKVPPSYIDLGHFAQQAVEQSQDQDLVASAQAVLDAVNKAVIAERHGGNKSGSTGISIYFPNSQLYGSPVAGPQSYNAVASRFVDESLWDDFLAYHYTGRTFDPAPAPAEVSSSSADVVAPGGGEITISPVEKSSDSVAPGETVLLSVDISGDNVGYIKLFAGFWDRDANSIYKADTDFLEAGDTREIGGVYYPDWGEGDFTMEFEWEPFLFAIDDGQTKATALFEPQDYGASRELAVYTVDGIYTYTDGETRVAQLHFVDGQLGQVFGFANDDGSGAPREIVTQVGDTFTLLEQWMDLDSNGRVVDITSEPGTTLTFGEDPFLWTELDAAAGEYVVGFIVEDLDGGAVESYTQVTVE
jgi:hypothetical protein